MNGKNGARVCGQYVDMAGGVILSGVDQINNKILQEARDSSRVKIDLALGRARKITDAARHEAGHKIKSMLDDAEKKASDANKRIMALAEIEVRKERLQVRQELVRAAFDRTREMLVNMPDEEYCGFLTGMLLQALQQEQYEIVLSQRDRERIGTGLMESILQLVQAAGKQTGIRLSDTTADISGGFILRTEELELNYSFEAILRTEQEQLQKIAYSKLGLA